MLTRNQTRPALVHHARIIDVDMSTFTVNVATEFTQKLLTNVTFMVPYTHPNNGEGIYFMPEVGSLCWLCEPSDGSMPFILGWVSAQQESDFSARKQGLNPGDIYLGTRDENFLWLRRGGVVQIGATGICQRIFLPVNNTINDFCENYNLHSLGGDLTWNIQRSENDTTGDRPALFTLAAKQFANDEEAIATLEIGSHGSNDNTILSLSILASGAQGAAEQISLKMDDQGNVTWVVQQNVSYTVSGAFSISVTGDYSVASQGNVAISGVQSAALSSKGSTTVEGDQGVTIQAPTTNVTGNFQVGGGGQPLAVAPVLVTWLSTHTHPIPMPGSSVATGPPVEPIPSNAASAVASVSS
jgi:hypothetical protein